MNNLSLDASFELTFELGCFDYWTIVLPARPGGTAHWTNDWYASDMSLHRGFFLRERDAHIWAHERLNGGPYSVRFVDLDGEADEPPTPFQLGKAWAALSGWPTERDPFATLREDPSCEESQS